MRILLYNFVQPEEPGAGGVGVYTRNLADALSRDHEVIALSSGDRYSPRRQEPRLEFSRDAFDRAVVVNSPVIAPAAYTFGDMRTYLDSDGLDFVPGQLAQRYGRIDVFHFHNIEGLTRSFFYRLRETFPEARILYSVHNYHQLCARVSLWYQNRAVCGDYRDGEACTVCHAPVFNTAFMTNRRRLIWAEKKYPRAMAFVAPATRAAKWARRTALSVRARGRPELDQASTSLPTAPAADYRAFRLSNIELCRNVFDRVLAVSERTGKVIVDRGVPADAVAVSYIGTAHKSEYLRSEKIRDVNGGLHLGYIGYMAREKGFNFLLECMERMPADLAAQITLTIAAKKDPVLHPAMQARAGRFKALRYFDGYTHSNLGDVLAGVNLGLVPVLWEDNLPQTAIELVSRGIPILTSDRGGAQEIAENPAFIFNSGDHADFIDRIARIADGTLSLAAFWERPMRIFSMEEHVADLLRYYAPQTAI